MAERDPCRVGSGLGTAQGQGQRRYRGFLSLDTFAENTRTYGGQWYCRQWQPLSDGSGYPDPWYVLISRSNIQSGTGVQVLCATPLHVGATRPTRLHCSPSPSKVASVPRHAPLASACPLESQRERVSGVLVDNERGTRGWCQVKQPFCGHTTRDPLPRSGHFYSEQASCCETDAPSLLGETPRGKTRAN